MTFKFHKHVIIMSFMFECYQITKKEMYYFGIGLEVIVFVCFHATVTLMVANNNASLLGLFSQT